MNGNPAEAQASSRLLYKLLKLKARTALWPSATLGSRFFRGVEDVAQIDFVELDRGLGGRLERGLDLGRLAGGGIKGFGEAKAERGERFRVGLFLVGRGGRAVDPLRHADEDRARELEVRVLERLGERRFLVLARFVWAFVGVAHATERSGGAGRLARTKNMEPTPARSAR